MRQADDALKAFLLSKQPFWTADIFTFTLIDGGVLRFTSADYPLYWGGTKWEAVGPLIQRTRWNVKNTLEVPTLDVTVLTTGDDYSGGNINTLAHSGVFDGCKLTLQRGFMPTPGDLIYGAPVLFEGKTGGAKIGAKGVKFTFKGQNVKLQQYMPKNRFVSTCIHNLFDAGCGAARPDFTYPWTIGGGNTTTVIHWGTSSPSYADNFGLGTVLFTSGPAAGQRRTIDHADGGAFFLAHPLDNVPQSGDTISITYGCDKSRDGSHGCVFFHQEIHFRGFRFIPQAETGL